MARGKGENESTEVAQKSIEASHSEIIWRIEIKRSISVN